MRSEILQQCHIPCIPPVFAQNCVSNSESIINKERDKFHNRYRHNQGERHSGKLSYPYPSQVGRNQSGHSYFWVLKRSWGKGAYLQRTKEEALPETPVSQTCKSSPCLRNFLCQASGSEEIWRHSLDIKTPTRLTFKAFYNPVQASFSLISQPFIHCIFKTNPTVLEHSKTFPSLTGMVFLLFFFGQNTIHCQGSA